MSGVMTRRRVRARKIEYPMQKAFYLPQRDRRRVRPDLALEHGRLVTRLKRLVARAQVTGLPAARAARMINTVRDVIVIERLMDADPVARAAAIADPLSRASRRYYDVRPADVQRRMAQMAPGAGLELVTR